ncbi:glutamate methylesterase CheB [alpha proteobacterium U9-1i]|nr:glutamate methylesterase CheB [alpha proteobacterium U9-1i]
MSLRVLIVDDSPTMRAMIAGALAGEVGIEVAGFAADPIEAREAIKQLNPDVITLDVEMPRMNGIEFLERLMRLRPTPVIMVSTLTQEGADVTLQALEMGAFDCVGKPRGGDVRAAFRVLPDLIRAAATARLRARNAERVPTPSPQAFAGNDNILAIGSSTGGVEALQTLLASFPANCPPTVITQHMPPVFTRNFASRLDRLCGPHVCEAEDGMPLRTGSVYLAPGGDAHLRVERLGREYHCRLVQSPPVNGHCPSVDELFGSVAQAARDKAVGVLLTGMGRDGAQGLLQMRQAGARTIGQDEASCVVYGMPKVAHEIGAVERQMSLSRIAAAALSSCSAQHKGVS